MDINMTNNDYYEFETTNPNLKGLVVISHGMAEHIGRYSWLIEKLNADGYIVIAKDHRGHGKNILKGMTPGLFANNDGWTKVGDDLRNTLNFAIKKYPNLDCFLLGHSMGSWIALSLLDRKLNINGLIITGSSANDQNILKLIRNLNDKKSIRQATLATMSSVKSPIVLSIVFSIVFSRLTTLNLLV